MARPRRQHQATDAAQAASEAARILAQRGHEVRQEQEPAEKIPVEPKDDWTPPERNTIHKKAMDEIAAKRGLSVEPDVETKEEVKEEIKDEPKVEAPVETKVEETPPIETPKTVRAKVDGEEFDVPAEEVEEYGGIKAYQIQKAAENRLKKTNEALAETRRAQAEFMEFLKASQKPKEPEVTDDQYIAERIDKMRFGTPEESAQAIKEILHRANKPLDQNAIIEQATNRFRHDQAVSQFDTEFQDIVTNPLLLRLVVSLRNERIPQLKGQVDWTQFYRTIGNEVRGVAGKPTSITATQSTTSGTPSQQSDKEARKAASVVSIPTAAARAAPPQEEKPETRQDLIREMRKKRGLPVD